MSNFSLLSMLQTKPELFYSQKTSPEEKGQTSGEILRKRKLARQAEMRPRYLELLKEYKTYSEMAQALGISKVTVQLDIKADPELKKLAKLYIKNGGARRRTKADTSFNQ